MWIICRRQSKNQSYLLLVSAPVLQYCAFYPVHIKYMNNYFFSKWSERLGGGLPHNCLEGNFQDAWVVCYIFFPSTLPFCYFIYGFETTTITWVIDWCNKIKGLSSISLRLPSVNFFLNPSISFCRLFLKLCLPYSSVVLILVSYVMRTFLFLLLWLGSRLIESRSGSLPGSGSRISMTKIGKKYFSLFL